jgi:hypothetical protein
MLRWSTQSQTKKQIAITPPDASYEPAAMAVLEGMYMGKPWVELLADLTPQQQLQAAVLADMWQLPGASTAAVDLLTTPTDDKERLSAMLEGLLSLAAVPELLLPVFEQVLFSRFGDLEAVWAPGGAALQDSLMLLPLPAMQLLLASDKLKVRRDATLQGLSVPKCGLATMYFCSDWQLVCLS